MDGRGVLFRTLKSGCRVEQRRFERLDRFLPCLAVYLIVTWRTLYVCRLAREFPNVGCDLLFEPEEWKSVYQVVRRQSPPPEPPKLSEMVCMIAQLGGYVDRVRPDPPGPQTVWLGLQRAHDMALRWLAFGPEAKSAPVV
ncbi:MAG TPA: IS4 family transposase [Pirellulales bacterium]|nr:IS4 family transposase [Pirellulales bacterium]